ncbi:FAD-binding oxidoreductase [Spirosoma gilvum]
MNYRKSVLQSEKHQFVQQLRNENHPIHPAAVKTSFSREAMAGLEERVKGRIVWPWSPSYNQDRQEFDNIYPAYPLVIIYAVTYSDVRISLEFAHKYSLHTAIRSGGHSFAGYSVCDGLVIDVSGLNNIYVDVANQTAWIETGCNFEKICPTLELYHLHIPSGGCPTVCIGGYMQGGGYGMTSRMYGMNCDNVLACTVMLADGRIVVASDTQNEDLFWAIRGGTGGNFGVLLSIKYKLHRLGKIYGLQLKWPIEPAIDIAAEVLYTIQEKYLQPDAFPNLGIETILTSDPNDTKSIFFCATWIGDQDAFMEVLQPLLHLGMPEALPIKFDNYSVINEYVLQDTPNTPDDVEAYSRSTIIERSLSCSEWKDILQFFLTAPNQYTMIDLECYGGQINKIPEGTNAFIHRTAKMDFFCLSFFDAKTNDQKECEEWMEAYYRFMATYSNGHSYQNYPDRNQKDFRWAYWGTYYNQLVAIKNKYDPTNFFHYQQSIGPGLLEDNNQILLFIPKEIIYETY